MFWVKSGMQTKYNFTTAVSMVVGIVIGSGVFFKAEKIQLATGGNLWLGIAAWLLGGVIMLICTYTFSVLAAKYEQVNGLIDYADAALGSRYGYFVGWFLCVVYYPTLAAALSWVAARYSCVLLGVSATGGEALLLTAAFLIFSFAINALSPVLAGRIQVTCTVIKLIPLLVMGIVGTCIGLYNGILTENMQTELAMSAVGGQTQAAHPLFVALSATAYAYDGWIVATCINAELKDAKRTLPRALLVGSCIVIFVYTVYYIGLSGVIPKQILIESGENGIRLAFEALFPRVGGVLLFVFVILSCLGTLNGIMMGCSRGLYSLAVRREGPKPQLFSTLNPFTDMPAESAILGLLLCMIWLIYFYAADLAGRLGFWRFDMTELPSVTLYAIYIPIFVLMMVKGRGRNVLQRFVAPCAAVASCLFMVFSACLAHGWDLLSYLLVLLVILLIGAAFAKKKA